MNTYASCVGCRLAAAVVVVACVGLPVASSGGGEFRRPRPTRHSSGQAQAAPRARGTFQLLAAAEVELTATGGERPESTGTGPMSHRGRPTSRVDLDVRSRRPRRRGITCMRGSHAHGLARLRRL